MFRMSLREMLILVALVAMAIASLKYANDTWVALVAGVAMVAFVVAIIVAVVDRGPRQAFAIGFALTIVAYGAILLAGRQTVGGGGNVRSQNIEFNYEEGRLPTTRLLRYAHQAVATGYYFDFSTGKALPNYDPNRPGNPTLGGGGFFGGGVSYREIPPQEKFMPIGHCWWALLLGYAGGQFARFVHRRRLRDEQKLPAETS